MPVPRIDETHDTAITSWIESANGHPDFPLQNLPLCAFTPSGESARHPRGGVRIGDVLLDLAGLADSGVGGARKLNGFGGEK